MIKTKSLLVSILLFSITGCVSSYVPPSDGVPSATLSFKISHASMLAVFENGKDCSKKVRVPDAYNPFKENSKPLIIAAGKEFAISQSHSIGFPEVTTCSVITSFIPSKGQQYRATYTMFKNKCIGTIEKLNPKSGKWLKESSAKNRKFARPMWEDGAFCELDN